MSTSVSGARGTGFNLFSRRGKVWSLNAIPFVSIVKITYAQRRLLERGVYYMSSVQGKSLGVSCLGTIFLWGEVSCFRAEMLAEIVIGRTVMGNPGCFALGRFALVLGVGRFALIM